jgi:IS5 family transposase
MLRAHWVLPFCNPAMEDVLYDIESMRHFADLKLDLPPAETTILKFRHFLEY